MNTKTNYLWRSNFTSTLLSEEKFIRGKVAFKTKETQWIETQTPSIVFVSIHSSFHETPNGDLKMNAFISTIKNHVKGKVTVLFCDCAHLKAMSIQNLGDLKTTYDESLLATYELYERYKLYFKDCNVVYWHNYINQDDEYFLYVSSLQELYKQDSIFKKLILEDAVSTYSESRMQSFLDKDLYIEKTMEDLIEQCAAMLVLSKKGYQYIFYPGKPYACYEYINQAYLPIGKKISWIDVFLSIEKKTFLEVQ